MVEIWIALESAVIKKRPEKRRLKRNYFKQNKRNISSRGLLFNEKLLFVKAALMSDSRLHYIATTADSFLFKFNLPVSHFMNSTPYCRDAEANCDAPDLLKGIFSCLSLYGYCFCVVYLTQRSSYNTVLQTAIYITY